MQYKKPSVLYKGLKKTQCARFLVFLRQKKKLAKYPWKVKYVIVPDKDLYTVETCLTSASFLFCFLFFRFLFLLTCRQNIILVVQSSWKNQGKSTCSVIQDEITENAKILMDSVSATISSKFYVNILFYFPVTTCLSPS